MSPEQIKAIETRGARKAILAELDTAKADLTEAINSYRQIEPTFHQARLKQIEFTKQIRLHITNITTLIDHLESGT